MQTNPQPDTTRAFAARVYKIVAAIPPGCVVSYGQLALLAGRPRGARLAGKALGHAPAGLPCHRVVNSTGRTAPGWAQQRTLLESEGVAFKPNGCVNMKRHAWWQGWREQAQPLQEPGANP